jgi:hypothetical protein
MHLKRLLKEQILAEGPGINSDKAVSTAMIKGRWGLWVSLWTVAVFLAGCASRSVAHYTAPRMTGRILDEVSGEPLSDVRVRRLPSESNAQLASAGHGGERLLDAGSEVRTGNDGRFLLESVRTLGFLWSYGWYSVTVSFERSGYQTLVRSYTLTDSTNTPSGEPLVQTGDVLLSKVPK